MKIKATFALLSLSAALALACEPESTNAPGDGGGSADGGSTAAAGPYKTLDITLPDINEDDYTIVSKTKDDLHILCFWAVWCTPCQAELKKMGPMWEKMKDRGLNVYAVSTDGPDTASRVAGFAQQEGYPFPVLMDRDTEVLAKYNPKGDIPFYVILDADGNVVKSHQGYVKGDMPVLEAELDKMLPAAGGAAPEDAAPAEAAAE
jgi:peroxiredoxin